MAMMMMEPAAENAWGGTQTERAICLLPGSLTDTGISPQVIPSGHVYFYVGQEALPD